MASSLGNINSPFLSPFPLTSTLLIHRLLLLLHPHPASSLQQRSLSRLLPQARIFQKSRPRKGILAGGPTSYLVLTQRRKNLQTHPLLVARSGRVDQSRSSLHKSSVRLLPPPPRRGSTMRISNHLPIIGMTVHLPIFIPCLKLFLKVK